MNNEVLIQKLEKKFDALKLHEDEGYFMPFELDYIEFICQDQTIGQIIEQLALEGKVSQDTLVHLMTRNSIRDIADDKPLTTPTFLTKKLELALHPGQAVLSLMETMKKEDDERTAKGLPVIDETTKHLRFRAEDLFLIHRLHNAIIEVLEKGFRPVFIRSRKPHPTQPVQQATSSEPIIRKPLYWQEGYLFLVYKLLKGNERSQDKQNKSEFSISNDMQPQNWPAQITMMSLAAICGQLKIQLKGLKFYTDIYKKYCKDEYEKGIKFIQENPDNKQAQLLKKVFDSKFDIQDFNLGFLVGYYGIYEFIAFDTKLDTKTEIGTPVANVTVKNISTKTVDAFKVHITTFDKFGDPANGFLKDNTYNGISQDHDLAPGESYEASWDLYNYDTTAKVDATPYQVHFTDGSSWESGQ